MNHRFCPACGAELKSDASFCTQCGHRLLAAGPRPGRRGLPLLLIGLAGAAVYVIFTRRPETHPARERSHPTPLAKLERLAEMDPHRAFGMLNQLEAAPDLNADLLPDEVDLGRLREDLLHKLEREAESQASQRSEFVDGIIRDELTERADAYAKRLQQEASRR